LQADPCSLSCGHSFDRYCIARSLAVKRECPTCRCPQESATPPQVAVLLRDALALLFPDEIAARGQQLEEERAAERVRLANEAAARAEEARRRAAQPRPLNAGAPAMLAVFQMILPTAAAQVRAGPEANTRERQVAVLGCAARPLWRLVAVQPRCRADAKHRSGARAASRARRAARAAACSACACGRACCRA